MKKFIFSGFVLGLLCLGTLVFTGCKGGQTQTVESEDSLSEDIVTPLMEEVPLEIEGVMEDEMMSTVTITTEDSTITYVKGDEFDSDAAIGDKVKATLKERHDELEVIKVEKL